MGTSGPGDISPSQPATALQSPGRALPPALPGPIKPPPTPGTEPREDGTSGAAGVTGPAMSSMSRPAVRGAQGPRGPPKRPHSLGVLAGSGNTAESVIDPDMEALFEDFLGREVPLLGPASPRPSAQPYHYVLRDPEQKGLCLRDGQLVATSLQGANADQEEPISVVPNRHLERRRCPLIVGIRGGSRALSCGTGPEPRLHLEDVGLLELFSREGDEAKPFTFYKTFGGSTHTFEAAAFPGLFLSTAPGPGEALAMAPPHGATAFYLRRK